MFGGFVAWLVWLFGIVCVMLACLGLWFGCFD